MITDSFDLARVNVDGEILRSLRPDAPNDCIARAKSLSAINPAWGHQVLVSEVMMYSLDRIYIDIISRGNGSISLNQWNMRDTKYYFLTMLRFKAIVPTYLSDVVMDFDVNVYNIRGSDLMELPMIQRVMDRLWMWNIYGPAESELFNVGSNSPMLES